MQVLAGDIGGTRARLAIAQVDAGGRVTVGRAAEYPSQAYPGLAPIVQEFLAAAPAGAVERIERACYAVACPIEQDECKATNLPWIVSRARLAAATGIAATRLVNDFLAIGYGLSQLGPADLVTLQPGRPEPGGTLGLIGAGTGLGKAYVTFANGKPVVHPSEGGHVDFGPHGPLEAGLLEHLRQEFGRVSAERVVSGPGLVGIYRYLAGRGAAEQRAAVVAEMQHEDPAAVVSRYGLERRDPLSTLALDVFIRAYGAEAGNLALTLLARGGLYVVGSIAVHNIPRILEGIFLEAFLDKGRMRPLLETIPLHIITNTEVGLLGAAVAAAE